MEISAVAGSNRLFCPVPHRAMSAPKHDLSTQAGPNTVPLYIILTAQTRQEWTAGSLVFGGVGQRAASLAYYQIAGGTITPCTNRDTHFSPTMEMYGYSPSSTLQPIR